MTQKGKIKQSRIPIPADPKDCSAGDSTPSTGVNQLPASNNHLPTDNSEISADNNQLPASNNQLLAGNSQLSAAGNGQLSATNSQLPTSNSQLSADNSQLPAGNSWLTTGSSQPTVDSSRVSTRASQQLPESKQLVKSVGRKRKSKLPQIGDREKNNRKSIVEKTVSLLNFESEDGYTDNCESVATTDVGSSSGDQRYTTDESTFDEDDFHAFRQQQVMKRNLKALRKFINHKNTNDETKKVKTKRKKATTVSKVYI